MLHLPCFANGLISWKRFRLMEIRVGHIIKFLTFVRPRNSITIYITVCTPALFCVTSIYFTPSNCISWRHILRVSFNLRPCFPSGPLSSGFPTKILRTFLIHSMRAALHPIILTCRVSFEIFCHSWTHWTVWWDNILVDLYYLCSHTGCINNWEH